jgi:hypothetical protein
VPTVVDPSTTVVVTNPATSSQSTTPETDAARAAMMSDVLEAHLAAGEFVGLHRPRDVDALERIRREFLNGDVLPLELLLLPGAACGGEEGKLADGELALFEATDHLRAHSARGSDDGDVFQGAHGIRFGGG